MPHRQDADATKPHGPDARATSHTSSQAFFRCVAMRASCSTSFVQGPTSRGRLQDHKKTVVPAKEATAMVQTARRRGLQNRSTGARAFQIARTQQGSPVGRMASGVPTMRIRLAGRFSDLHLTERLLPVRRRRTVDYASRISEESVTFEKVGWAWAHTVRGMPIAGGFTPATLVQSRCSQRRDRRGFSPRSRLPIPRPESLETCEPSYALGQRAYAADRTGRPPSRQAEKCAPPRGGFPRPRATVGSAMCCGC